MFSIYPIYKHVRGFCSGYINSDHYIVSRTKIKIFHGFKVGSQVPVKILGGQLGVISIYLIPRHGAKLLYLLSD